MNLQKKYDYKHFFYEDHLVCFFKKKNKKSRVQVEDKAKEALKTHFHKNKERKQSFISR